MQLIGRFIIVSLLLMPFAGFGQKDSLINKLDSLKKQTDTTGQHNATEPGFYDERTKVNARVFGTLLLDDFKQQALSPLDINNKRAWLTGAALVGTTVGISFLDKPIQQWAAGLRRRNPTLHSYSKTITDLGGVYEIGTFAGIAAYGFIFKSPKLRTTTALATQAYITSTFWSTLFKTLSGRLRPHDIDANSNLNVSRFHGPFYSLPYGGNSAFPSGHATLAFAAARVYAMEYKNVPAIPIIAYSMASLVSFSRIIENRHWSTDIFAGALLGWACGTQVVNNYHRYARLIRTGAHKNKKKGDITFNLNYQPGVGVQPGITYKFR